MSNRTLEVTERIGSRLAIAAACTLLGSLSAGGCVLGNDNDRPVLAVDPIWDLTPTDRFSGGGCGAAGVVSMTWAIEDSRGRTIKEAEKLDECQPLDFLGLVPGRYRLQLRGYDRDDVERWSSTCTDLVLGRFDVLYRCEVDQVEPDEGAPSEEDAGMSDAGEPDAGS